MKSVLLLLPRRSNSLKKQDLSFLADKSRHNTRRVLFFSLFCAYAFLAVLGTSDYDILLKKPIVIPGLRITLPLLSFYIVIPAVIVALHFGVLWMHKFCQIELEHMSPEKIKKIPFSIFDAIYVEKNNIWLKICITFLIYFFPLVTLIAFFMQFTKYQNFYISLWHAFLAWLDLLVIYSLISISREIFKNLIYIFGLFLGIFLLMFNSIIEHPSYYTRDTLLAFHFPHLKVTHINLNEKFNINEAKAYQELDGNQTKRPYLFYITKQNLRNRNLILANLSHTKMVNFDFRGAKLIGANLEGSQLQYSFFSEADLNGAILRDCDLKESIFDQANLKGANLNKAKLQNLDLSEAKLQGADLSQAKLQGADLSEAKLQSINLSGANLKRANLSRAKLQGVNLSKTELINNIDGANLKGADLSEAFLKDANLRGANLKGANLDWANMKGADLSWTGLQGACLGEAFLQGANLRGANLSGAYLGEAFLQGADLNEAKLQGTYLGGANLQGADLRKAKLQGADLSDALLHGTYLLAAQLQGTITNSGRITHNYDSLYLPREQYTLENPSQTTIFANLYKFIKRIGHRSDFSGLNRSKFSKKNFVKISKIIKEYEKKYGNSGDMKQRLNLLQKAIGKTSLEWLNMQKGKYSAGVLTWEEACKIQQEVTYPDARKRMGLNSVNWEEKCGK